ncbi:MAG: DUF362 domain-containing protein [Candidatus Lindowbacteria bacterium]|nr:DUF362 domain-containing protein [Candidatus Lindowbacteria bacterium]
MEKQFNYENGVDGHIRRDFLSRRDFIRTAAIGSAGIAFVSSQAACSAGSLSPRRGLGNIFMDGDKPLLVVAEGGDLRKMLEAGIDALGGINRLVAGKKVVIKPNTVYPHPPPVTTDIQMVLAVAKYIRDGGATSITVCDGNSSGTSKAVKFEALGYPQRLKEAGIRLDAGDATDRMSHAFVSKDTWRSHPTIGVLKTVHEADVVVNLPMIKRHDSARFTCALKNNFGTVYRPLRFVSHSKWESNRDFFDRSIVEFADAVRPELNIVDGRALLTRDGPRLSGRAEVKSGVNKIILCGDMPATDVYCSHLMQEHDDTFSPEMISFQLATAAQLGLGVTNLSNVIIKEIIA